MPNRPVEIGPAGLHAARATEHLRLVCSLPQHQLAAPTAALLLPWLTHTAPPDGTLQSPNLIQEALLG
ncbi:MULTISPECIES: XRE family transcriptional regulator [unclassified Streptomyces]|uniref:XRE family transcriptional regulator n=1 Tax=unclassified Streptomyces TaxID=2593676 RepID=UPI0036F74C5F